MRKGEDDRVKMKNRKDIEKKKTIKSKELGNKLLKVNDWNVRGKRNYLQGADFREGKKTRRRELKGTYQNMT